MERILSEIKSVPGVTGALVLSKESLVSYHFLPESFTPSTTKEVGTKLLKLSEKLPPHSRLDLKFENGIGLVYNLTKSVILIFGRSNLDFSLLGLVLKFALQSIEKKLEGEASPMDQVKEKLTFVIDKTNLNLLIEAINLIAQGYVEEQGAYRVTRNLRNTKEDIIREFPQMTNFYVDNQGKVSLLKAQEGMFDQKISLALIKWIDLFVNKTPHPSRRDRVADIRKLTAQISKPLEGIGFYDLYTKVAKKLV
jgi:predicted regulator of Ras-like GTPase activity (Roadblock/LC7/MglB family)